VKVVQNKKKLPVGSDFDKHSLIKSLCVALIMFLLKKLNLRQCFNKVYVMPTSSSSSSLLWKRNMSDKTRPVDRALQELKDIAVTPYQREAYCKAIRIYNPAYSTDNPGFVALPNNVEDVQRCLRVANKTKTDVVVKSGGHSFAGYSTIGKEGFVISLKNLNSVVVKDDVVIAQAGANWGDVYGALETYSYVAVGGCVPVVGIGGYILGGGYSMLSRANGGLGCDKAVSFTMITADGGQVVTASSTCNNDLFWAMKGGGGGNFGILVDVTLKVVPSPKEFIWKRLFYNDSESIERALNHIGENLKIFPKELNLDMATHSFSKTRNLTLDAVYSDQHEEIVEATLKALQAQESSTPKSYTSFLDLTKDYSKRHGFVHYEVEPIYVKGAMLNSISTSLSKYFANVDIPAECLLEFVHMGGDIKQFAPTKTAFPYRSAEYSFYTYGRFLDDEHKKEVIDFATRTYETVKKSNCALGSYVNYMDRDLYNWQHEFYGVNYNRLCEIKKKWNPLDKGSLHFQQEIGSSWQPNK